MYVCMYACMRVCMYVCTYICTEFGYSVVNSPYASQIACTKVTVVFVDLWSLHKARVIKQWHYYTLITQVITNSGWNSGNAKDSLVSFKKINWHQVIVINAWIFVIHLRHETNMYFIADKIHLSLKNKNNLQQRHTHHG